MGQITKISYIQELDDLTDLVLDTMKEELELKQAYKKKKNKRKDLEQFVYSKIKKYAKIEREK